MLTANLISPNDLRWSNLLDHAPHDFYDLPEYCLLEAERLGGNAVGLILQSDEWAALIPLVVRSLPPHHESVWKDAISPYGYPGVVVRGIVPPGDAEEISTLIRETLREMTVLTAFLRMHPLLDVGEPTLRLGVSVAHSSIVYRDLRSSEEDLWSQTRMGHRSDIRSLMKSGYSVQFDRWDDLPAFTSLYRETMARVVARDEYFFSDAYFDNFRRALGRRFHLAAVRDPDGNVVAASILAETAGIVQYHLSGSLRLKIAPSKLLLHQASLWAKDRGNEFFFLGGGFRGNEDPLFLFKRGFSHLTAPFRTVRIVCDEQEFSRITDEPGNRTGFFPPYRA